MHEGAVIANGEQSAAGDAFYHERSEGTVGPMKKHFSKGWVKLLVSGGLIGIILLTVDLNGIRRTLHEVSFLVVLGSALAYALSMFITAYKWRLLVKGAGIETTYGRVLRATFLGMYLNCFGFGTVGGDIARGLLVAPGTSRKDTCLATVIADRVIGLAVLASIGLLATALFGSQAVARTFSGVAIVLVVGGAIGWVLGPEMLLRLTAPLPKLQRICARILAAFPRDPILLLKVIGLALSFHVMQVLTIALIVADLGATVPWWYFFVAVPFINIASTLPLSWMGLGVRESAYKIFFVNQQYLTMEQAVLTGAIWLLGMTLASAAGGILAVLTGDLRLLKAQKEEPEREAA